MLRPICFLLGFSLAFPCFADVVRPTQNGVKAQMVVRFHPDARNGAILRVPARFVRADAVPARPRTDVFGGVLLSLAAIAAGCLIARRRRLFAPQTAVVALLAAAGVATLADAPPRQPKDTITPLLTKAVKSADMLYGNVVVQVVNDNDRIELWLPPAN